jgi:hypothetical protein
MFILAGMNINIPVNRKRVPYAVLLFLLLTIFFLLNYIYHWDGGDGEFGFSDALLRILPIAFGLLLTFLALADYMKTLFDRSAGLTLSETGIHDNLSIFSLGHLPWQDVTGAEIIRVSRFDLLIIHLADKEKYMAKKKHIIRRTLKNYATRYGSPVVISRKRIDYDLQQLREEITGRVNSHALS